MEDQYQASMHVLLDTMEQLYLQGHLTSPELLDRYACSLSKKSLYLTRVCLQLVTLRWWELILPSRQEFCLTQAPFLCFFWF